MLKVKRDTLSRGAKHGTFAQGLRIIEEKGLYLDIHW